ncbi:MAG: hypothetical protein ABUK01_02770 [Leptospirales bacterium]
MIKSLVLFSLVSLFLFLPISQVASVTEVKEKKVAIVLSVKPLQVLYDIMFGDNFALMAQVNLAVNSFSHLNLNAGIINSYYANGYSLGVGYRINFAAFNKKVGITGLNGLYIGPAFSYANSSSFSTSTYLDSVNQSFSIGYEFGHQWVLKSGFTFGVRLAHLVEFTEQSEYDEEVLYRENSYMWDYFTLQFDIGWSF